MIGREIAKFATDELVEISANIDDLNPQIYGHLSDRCSPPARATLPSRRRS